MSNFNQYFRNTGAKLMVDRFFKGVDAYNLKHKLNIVKWFIVDDEIDKPASYYIENSLTATHKVQIDYMVDDGPEILSTQFEVPREIDGSFIIEGAYRIATNSLGSDYDCRIQMSGSMPFKINFDYNRQYEIATNILRVKRINEDTGYQEKVKEYSFDEIDNVKGGDREDLRLNERQQKKFQIKLDIDYKPEYITKKLIEDCLAYGDDRIKDLVIDKTIESVPQGFINFLFKSGKGKAFFATRRKITSYWTKFSKLQDPVNSITMLCRKHWKGSSENAKGGSEIQVPPGINAINLQSISVKIKIPDTVAYNTTFSDLIDIADTPINQSSNKINALTVSTHITDNNEVLFDTMTKDFKKVTIDYYDYLNSKVAASEFVDYEKHELKPDKDGKVEVKYRMKRKMVDPSEIDLIDLPPDYRLSATSRRIPFLNYTDSVRIEMGTGLLKQAIPLPNAERPLVDTGNREELETNILNEKFTYSEGKVKAINDSEVVIELPNKDEVSMPRRTAIQSDHDIDVFTEPKVKVGQKVHKGDIITGAVGLDKETYKSGINALVLFHAMLGYVHEDAVVVSQSFADKMCHYSLIDLSVDIKNTEAIKWIAPIGTRVKFHDRVATVYRTSRLDEVNKKMADQLGGLFGDISEYTVEGGLEVPNNIDDAVVSDVLFQENKIRGMKGREDLTFTRTSDKVIKEYENTKNRKIIYDKYPEYIASDTLNPVNLSEKDDRVIYTIRIRLIKTTKLMPGSKLTNRYGGKGVISKILPDNVMPIMVDPKGNKKTVEVVMNPYSTINRKIPSVLMENSLGLICHRLRDLVEEYKTTKGGKEKIKPLLVKYYPGRFDNMTTDEIIKMHDNTTIENMYYFNVGSFTSKFSPDSISKWMEELGVEPQSKILMPQNQIADLKELKENLSEEDYNKAVSKMTGKYTEVDKPLMCGYVTMLEIFKIPYYDERSTSSMFFPDGDVNPFKASPILGHGSYRSTGQSIGEMELWTYLSKGSKKFIDYSRGDTYAQDSMEFMNNLLGLGLTIKNDEGYNMGASSLRNSLREMKVKFRLKK